MSGFTRIVRVREKCTLKFTKDQLSEVKTNGMMPYVPQGWPQSSSAAIINWSTSGL